MTDDKSKQKDLIDLLPSNILSEVDVDSEGSQGYVDNDDEIVDVIIFFILLGLGLPPQTRQNFQAPSYPNRAKGKVLLRQQRPDVPTVPAGQA